MEVEKQWRMAIERDVESVLMKGLQKKFEIEMKKRDGLVKDSWFDFIDEMKNLFRELKHFISRYEPNVQTESYSRRTNSDANFDVSLRENLLIEGLESRHVWKIIESYEAIISEQRKLSLPSKRNVEIKSMERKIKNAITRLENFTTRNNNHSVSVTNRAQERRRARKPMIPKSRRSDNTIQISEGEVKKLKEERDESRFQIAIFEDTCRILLRGMMEDFSHHVGEIFETFRVLVDDFEVVLHQNLESKCSRLDSLKREVDELRQPLDLLRTRKLLYEKAFITRSCNLKLAETEVDLLGDQVESLLVLLERIFVALNRNATVLSSDLEVHDILKLIEIELNGGRSCN